jgi:Glycosyl transferase family 2
MLRCDALYRGEPAGPLQRFSPDEEAAMIAEETATTRSQLDLTESEPQSHATLSVVIPALNEEDGIAAIIERIEAVRGPLADVGVDGLEIIVVDDGSTDRTAEIASSYPQVRLIRHSTNRGYGAAIKTGFNNARGQWLAFTDADGTYPPERFPALCKVAVEQGADVVVGSRRSGEHSEMPPMRRVGNFVWSNLVSVIGNHRVADPASGMRVLRATALRKLYPLPDGLNFTPVMSTRCVHEDLKVIEVPIPYKERLGRSKLSIVRDGSRFLKTILWTSLEYNPVRVLGLVGISALAMSLAIGLGVLALRFQGVTQLGQVGTFSVFAALVLGVAGASIFSLGATFNYLVSLFRGEPVREGLFGRPLFHKPLDQQFGWMGLLTLLGGATVATLSFVLSVAGDWPTTRLWFWLMVAACLVLVGLQLVISWILMRVLETLSLRARRIEEEMAPTIAIVQPVLSATAASPSE